MKNKKPLTYLVWICLTAFLGYNIVAYNHAYRMTHFVEKGHRTKDPEALSLPGKLKTLFFGVTVPKPSNTITPKNLGLAYTRESFRSSDNTTLVAWKVRTPQAKARVLMFHGYAGRQSDLIYEAKGFQALGIEPVLISFRGSGKSSGMKTTIGYHETNDVLASIQKYRSKTMPLLLYGFSMGGAAILKAATKKQLPVQGVLLSCAFDSLYSTVKSRFRLMGLPSFPSAFFLTFWGGKIHGFDAFAHQPSEFAKKLKVPTLIIQGNKDARVSIKQAKTIFHNLAGKKYFYSFQGLGHGFFARQRPKEWNKMTATFLTNLGLDNNKKETKYNHRNHHKK